MKNYYRHILPGSVGLSIVRFCSKTSTARPDLEYLHYLNIFSA